ncbi:peptidylprolyl isomerase [Campylobacterota bacterium]|nr:peptidylprolyl isomerase [Campylobacterota bacterium]
MIAQLQRHRTFIVVVLAVTVFAFVGVGFVGWGQYSYGSKAGAVAVVGKEKITLEQYQLAFSNLYNFYSQFSDQPLDKEMETALQQTTLNTLIQEALLINYAHDLGLRVLPEEASRRIISMEAFQKDGKFDKQTYLAALANTRRDVRSFEAEIVRQMLIEKLSAYLQPEVTKVEKEALGASMFIADHLNLKIIKAPSQLSVSEAEAVAYHEANKFNFMGEPKYDLAYIKILSRDQQVSEEETRAYYERNKNDFVGANGEIAAYESVTLQVSEGAKFAKSRSEALRTKVAWRDGALTPQNATNLTLTNDILPLEVMQALEDSQSMEISNPIEIEGGFALAQIIKRSNSEPLSFTEARAAVTEAVRGQKRAEYLKSESAKQLNGFKSEQSVIVRRADTDLVKNLNEDEAGIVLEQIFDSTSALGTVLLEDKAVLYRIVEQKLFDESKLREADGMLGENIGRLKLGQIRQGLLQALQSRYPITLN